MPDPIDTDDLPDTERLRLNRDGYLEPWPDGMLCYYAHFKTVVSDLRADLSALRAREAEMRAALRPFAEYMHTNEGRMDCDYFGKPLPDDLTVGWIYLTHGDFRRARAALSQPDSGEGAT